LSYADYLDHLFKGATGWLGWTPDVALHTPMPLIELAMEGRYSYLRALNGIPEDDDQDPVVFAPASGPGGLMDYLRQRAKG
jgi:hypothetical protein